eukprot:TRINITY_DN7055_c2_g1_i1.p1 TRINITY_DN7055_c2_g1~~TRINITY_DN7055_c2_g1_i1.p1  ORF type:complete len:142 (+),score=16.35 TRINITY_DN7055_c2_g1_i1:86-511(+)
MDSSGVSVGSDRWKTGERSLRSVYDWVSLSSPSAVKTCTPVGRTKSLLQKLPERVFTIPVGCADIPHQGAVTWVRVTRHSSVQVRATSAPARRRRQRRESYRNRLPAAEGVSIQRESMILDRLLSGQVASVRDLPMPALFH